MTHRKVMTGYAVWLYDLMAGILKDLTAEQTAIEAAEQANRSKTSFLASVSHDIRTPMNAILGFVVLMEQEGGSVRLEVVEAPERKDGCAGVQFRVSDTGCGMTEEFAARVFEPFARDALRFPGAVCLTRRKTVLNSEYFILISKKCSEDRTQY